MRISDWSSDVCSSDLNYSEALRHSDLVWTEETIDRLFALGPDTYTPGSKMPLQRMPSAEDREDLIAYLKAITAAKGRSEERRVGKECVSTCRYRWSPYH